MSDKKIVALLICFFALAACSSKKEEKQAGAPVAEVETENEYPDILLQLSDGTEMRAKSLEGNNLFVLFQPDCDHCQEEAIHIEQRLGEFKNYTLFFISSAPMDQITGFARNFQLHNKTNVRFAWTATEGVLDNYGPIQTPSVYIYRNGRLTQSFNGQTDIENILGAL